MDRQEAAQQRDPLANAMATSSATLASTPPALTTPATTSEPAVKKATSKKHPAKAILAGMCLLTDACVRIHGHNER